MRMRLIRPFGGANRPLFSNYGALLLALAAFVALYALMKHASTNVNEALGAPSQAKHSWSHDWTDELICSDSCPSSRDGQCQEGRPGLRTKDSGKDGPFSVQCDLGTDCTDCGPWRYVGPKQGLSWTPVKDLVHQNVELYVRTTATPVPFWMPYTNPELDVDVSGQMNFSALIEPGITWVWHKLLSEGCAGTDGERGLVLDVGANFGYYSLMSAAMGCHVVAWEPVPRFSAFLKYGLQRNLFAHSVELRERVVAETDGGVLTLEVPTTGIWGTAGIGGKNINSFQRSAEVQKVRALSERVDTAVAPQSVLIMKVDVEGFEPGVLSSAKKLLLQGDVENIIMEYSPGVAEVNKDWKLAETNPDRLLGLILAGYTILQIDETLRVLTGFDWQGDLPPMPAVGIPQLRHDIADVKLLQVGSLLGCPLPPTVELSKQMWSCSEPASFTFERLSPRGFRPTFGFNTNLWASKKHHAFASRGGPACLMPPEADGRSWFLPGKITYPHYPGHDFRVCDLEPPDQQVRLRCRCTDAAVCGLLEAAVDAAAAEGRMPPPPLEKASAAEYEELKIENWRSMEH